MIANISVCIIAKNEQKYIEDCLKSVKPIASEIILLDTGSTDRTIEIASKYATVYKTEWKDDFSLARNECLSYAKGDWILYLDADEILTEYTQQNLLTFLSTQNLNKPLAFYFKVYKLQPKEYAMTSFFKSVVFRNGIGINFVGSIYEYLNYSKGKLLIEFNPSFTLYNLDNYRPTQDIQAKTENYINKLLAIVENSKDKNNNYYYYYHLGNNYCQVGKYKEAIEYYYKSYSIIENVKIKSNHFYGSLLIKLIGTLLFCSSDYKDVSIFIDNLLKISPKFPDALFLSGYYKQKTGNFSEAIKIYENILKILSSKNKDDFNPLGLVSLEDSISSMLKFQLGRCYIISGDKSKGLMNLEQSYNEFPESNQVLLHIIKFYLFENNLKGASFYYFKNVSNVPANEKENIEAVSKLPVESPQYKSTILRFLKGLEGLDEWSDIELKSISEKIQELEKTSSNP